MRMSRKWLILILLAASVAAHFAFFGHPNQVVFDEVHFGKFASAYYTHQYYFDIHPPLGKLLIAGFGKLFNFHPEYSFANIGQAFPDKAYLALRFLPSLAGTLLPIIIFLLALELGLQPIAAFFAGMLTLLDNALLTQSRYILLDMFLLDFGFAGLFSYFKYRNTGNSRWLIPASILFGLSACVKWTGLAFIGLASIIELIDTIRNLGWNRVIRLVIYFGAIPFVVYYSIFMIHFALLTKTGDGDAFMTPEFRATLQGSPDSLNPAIKPLNGWQKFIELNKEMYTANQTLTATHPYGSKWYTWPLMLRPIYYWNGAAVSNQPTSISNPPAEEKIYLIGNPFIWWGSTVAMLYLLLSLLGKQFFKDRTALTLLGGYVINFLPFIGISRVMFLYHYLAGLIFAILMFAYCIHKTNRPRNLVIIFTIMAALLFIFFAPLSYGLPLDAHAFSLRMWLSSWQ
jgi:dolichyl-phosphate-mannose-protein mannosyltransferase